MRPGATDRMGLSAEELERLNPGLIQAHTTAFGWSGPYAHRPGVDPLAQAWMGLQFAQGGRGNPPVFLAQLAPTDFSSGGMIALGAIMALYARERTGVAQKVDCNLLNAGATLREDDFLRFEGKEDATYRGQRPIRVERHCIGSSRRRKVGFTSSPRVRMHGRVFVPR